MKPPLDLSLYLIVGPSHVAGDPVPLVRAAVEGGVTLLQLRDKTSDDAALIDMARRLKAVLSGTGVPLLINDRPDIAKAAGADGVHVGRADADPATARRLLGPDALIGVTVKTPDEARMVDPAVIDYASIGGVFETGSKRNPDPPIGLAGLSEMVAVLRAVAPDLPRCAIAGIDAATAEAVTRTGVDGICVVSAITRAEDPRAAARTLRAIVDGAREDHGKEPA
jgi:thiamine-phosphate pyrophosphorylase